MQRIATSSAPPPSGHYSQAVVHGGVIYTSVQLPLPARPDAARPVTIEDQARQVLRNLDAILRAAGSGIGHALRLTVYVADMAHWDRIDAVYSEVLGTHRPARGVLPVGGPLHLGFDVAAAAVAARLTAPDAP